MDLILGGETETPHAVEKLSLRAATAETCILWSLGATTRQFRFLTPEHQGGPRSLSFESFKYI